MRVAERIRNSAFILWWNKWYSQKKIHWAFPVFTGFLGVVLGLLISPQIGVICLILTVYLGEVIFIPWNCIFGKIGKSWLKSLLSYLTPAIVCILIAIPTFDSIVSIFPSPASKQEIENLKEQTAILSKQRLTIQANGAMILNKVPNMNHDPSYPTSENNPLYVFSICCPFVPKELLNEKSIIAVNYKYYVQSPLKIDSRQLSIDGKTLVSPTPSLFGDARPEYNTYSELLFLYFKYDGIIKPGRYDNVTLIVIAENTTFSSNTFTIIIPEPKKQEE